MFVLDKNKPISDMETKFPILQAEITEKGSVAAVLQDGEKHGLIITHLTEAL